MHIIALLRPLAHVKSSNELHEHCRIPESSVRKSLFNITEEVLHAFGSTNVLFSQCADLQKIILITSASSLLGCFGC